jgi:hypothetical protein
VAIQSYHRVRNHVFAKNRAGFVRKSRRAWHRVRVIASDLVAVCKYLIAVFLNACDTFCAATQRLHAHGFIVLILVL